MSLEKMLVLECNFFPMNYQPIRNFRPNRYSICNIIIHLPLFTSIGFSIVIVSSSWQPVFLKCFFLENPVFHFSDERVASSIPTKNNLPQVHFSRIW